MGVSARERVSSEIRKCYVLNLQLVLTQKLLQYEKWVSLELLSNHASLRCKKILKKISSHIASQSKEEKSKISAWQSWRFNIKVYHWIPSKWHLIQLGEKEKEIEERQEGGRDRREGGRDGREGGWREVGREGGEGFKLNFLLEAKFINLGSCKAGTVDYCILWNIIQYIYIYNIYL